VKDDYLWDRSGPPDPEIERLERTLAPLRGSDRPHRPLELARAPVERVAPPRRRWILVGGLAMAGAGAAGAVALRVRGGRKTVVAPESLPPTTDGWDLASLSGRPRVDGRVVEGASRLAVGQTLETDAESRARLEVPAVGSVLVDPGTRVSLLGTGAKAHRLRLAGGVLHATIFAPPGTFFVETPAGVAVDLGCAYTVQVGADGDGLITVNAGWVGFEQRGRESFIPQGAACAIRVRTGPGTPCFLDASARFRSALTAFDTSGAAREQLLALRTVLAEARAQDAATLWHLLERAPAESRARVLARLRALVPAARAVPAPRVLAGERKALDELWDRLGLGPIAVWRRWKADLDRDPGR
jgi:hypothetical protein